MLGEAFGSNVEWVERVFVLPYLIRQGVECLPKEINKKGRVEITLPFPSLTQFRIAF